MFEIMLHPELNLLDNNRFTTIGKIKSQIKCSDINSIHVTL